MTQYRIYPHLETVSIEWGQHELNVLAILAILFSRNIMAVANLGLV